MEFNPSVKIQLYFQNAKNSIYLNLNVFQISAFQIKLNCIKLIVELLKYSVKLF